MINPWHLSAAGTLFVKYIVVSKNLEDRIIKEPNTADAWWEVDVSSQPKKEFMY
jgi:hypothetical protein